MFDFLDGFDIEDWLIIGPLSEELAEDEKKMKKIEKNLDDDELDDFDEI